MVHNQSDIFTPRQEAQFAEQFGGHMLQRVYDGFRVASLPAKAGSISYVEVKADDEQARAIYIPGLTEGIASKIVFGAALAEQGITTIIPDQNRSRYSRNSLTTNHPTFQQAHNLLTVMRHSGYLYSNSKKEDPHPINVIAHSYGSLITEAMMQLSHARGFNCFNGASTAFVSPAGTGAPEKTTELARRFFAELLQEASADSAVKDLDKSLLVHGLKNFFVNPWRSVQEVRALRDDTVHYPRIKELTGGRTAIFVGRDEKLFNHDILKEGAATAGRHMTYPLDTYATPISYTRQDTPTGSVVGIDDMLATHNDDQANPRRVAGAVSAFILQSE